ncbi:MAG: class I SAM-dependent methyltransferase [Sneathiella sp.]
MTECTIAVSEVQFVEWSAGISPNDYDVVGCVDIIGNLNKSEPKGLDVGGGMGKFASAIIEAIPRAQIKIVDPSSLAEKSCVKTSGLQFQRADFLNFETDERYDFIIFKTVLHHLVGPNEKTTRKFQIDALNKARHLLNDNGVIIVEENFYESLGSTDVTGRLIFEITRLKFIEKLVRMLKANTAGEGVRFRSTSSWEKLFLHVKLRTNATYLADEWGSVWPLWQKIPLLGKSRYQAILALTKR